MKSNLVTLLEIMSYATTMFATGMQLPVACNYAGSFNGIANGFFPPFWVCMQQWCNYDHLHPNFWMISNVYI